MFARGKKCASEFVPDSYKNPIEKTVHENFIIVRNSFRLQFSSFRKSCFFFVKVVKASSSSSARRGKSIQMRDI